MPEHGSKGPPDQADQSWIYSIAHTAWEPVKTTADRSKNHLRSD